MFGGLGLVPEEGVDEMFRGDQALMDHVAEDGVHVVGKILWSAWSRDLVGSRGWGRSWVGVQGWKRDRDWGWDLSWRWVV
jgi:hypothetical protein